jgi:hypothetical protein
MSTRVVRFFLSGAFALGVVLPLTGCDQWALSVNSDGLLFVSIVGGDGNHRDRFRLRTRQSNGATRLLDVPPSGSLTLRDLSPGALELTLLPPERCAVAPPNPRTLTVGAEGTVRVAFDVRCGR